MRTPQTTWHWMWNETVRKLESFQRRVHEGKDLDAALKFAQYVLWSKMEDILKPHDCDGFLKVDSSFLRWKAEELQRSVTDAYQLGKAPPPAANKGNWTALHTARHHGVGASTAAKVRRFTHKDWGQMVRLWEPTSP